MMNGRTVIDQLIFQPQKDLTEEHDSPVGCQHLPVVRSGQFVYLMHKRVGRQDVQPDDAACA